MTTKDEGIVILGAGHAGGRVAIALREAGFDGRLRLVGEEAELPYERPPLSKAFLHGEVAHDSFALQPDGAYDAQGIEALTGTRAVGIDAGARRLDLGDAGQIGFDRLVIATGTRARSLPGVQADGKRVHMLRTHAEALALREALSGTGRLLVLGGGLIGLELAASARKLGWEVDVVEAAPHPLARVAPPTFGQAFAARHAAEGVRLHLGARLHKLELGAWELRAELDTGLRIEADLAVVSVGAVPNVDLAQRAGLACDDGIVVDATGQTSHPGIYAVGDVARYHSAFYGRTLRLESWDNAEKSAAAVADTLMGQPGDFDPLPWMWTDQYDMNVQILGLPEQGRQVTRGRLGDGPFVQFTLVDDRIRHAVMVNAGRERRPLTRLIQSGEEVDASRLADPSVPLTKLRATVA